MGYKRYAPGASVHERIRGKICRGLYFKLDSDQYDMLHTIARIRGVNMSDLLRTWIERDYEEWREEIKTDELPTVAHVEREIEKITAVLSVTLKKLDTARETLKLTREFKADSTYERSEKIHEMLRDVDARKRRQIERMERGKI